MNKMQEFNNIIIISLRLIKKEILDCATSANYKKSYADSEDEGGCRYLLPPSLEAPD